MKNTKRFKVAFIVEVNCEEKIFKLFLMVQKMRMRRIKSFMHRQKRDEKNEFYFFKT